MQTSFFIIQLQSIKHRSRQTRRTFADTSGDFPTTKTKTSHGHPGRPRDKEGIIIPLSAKHRILTKRIQLTRSPPLLSAHTHSREPKSDLQPTKSPHFIPRASIVKPRRARPKGQAYKQWQPLEKESLISLVNEGKSLGEISQQLPGRSKRALCHQYRIIKSRKQASKSQENNSLADIQETRLFWTGSEDQILTTNFIAGKSCNEISRLLPSRTATAVSRRWYNHLKSSHEDTLTVRSQNWSQREEQLLVSLHTAGESFAQIAQKISNRSREACQARWHQIKPHRHELKRWTRAEDKTLVSLFSTLGPRWYNIAKELPGRSSRACRNRYYRRTCDKEYEANGPSRKEWISHWESKFPCVQQLSTLLRKDQANKIR